MKEKRKSITWDPNIPEEGGAGSARLFKKPKTEEKHFKQIKRTIAQHARAGTYDQLREYLDGVGLDEAGFCRFYTEHGDFLLDNALWLGENDYLNFLTHHIPASAARRLLQNEDGKLIKGFIDVQPFIEEDECYTAAKRQSRIEKLKLLLSMDRDTVMRFMESDQVALDMPDAVKSEYQAARDALAENGDAAAMLDVYSAS